MFEMTEATGITMIDESDSDDNNNMEDDKITIPSFSNYLIDNNLVFHNAMYTY